MSVLESFLQFTVDAGAALDAARDAARDSTRDSRDVEACDDQRYERRYERQARALCAAVRALFGRAPGDSDAAAAILDAAPGLAYRFTRELVRR